MKSANIVGTIYCMFIVIIITMIVPYAIVRLNAHADIPGPGNLRFIGPILITIGLFGCCLCSWHFVLEAKGTPIAIDPKEHLMVGGPYRYVRNPMYISFFLIILGVTIYYQSLQLLFYLLGWIVFLHFVVIFYEEKALKYYFGKTYEEYCRSVHRWIPRFKAPSGANKHSSK